MSFLFSGLLKGERFLSSLADNLTGDTAATGGAPPPPPPLVVTPITPRTHYPNEPLSNKNTTNTTTSTDTTNSTTSTSTTSVLLQQHQHHDPLPAAALLVAPRLPPLPTIITETSLHQYYTCLFQSLKHDLEECGILTPIPSQQQEDICAALEQELKIRREDRMKKRNELQQQQQQQQGSSSCPPCDPTQEELEKAHATTLQLAKPILESLKKRFETLTREEYLSFRAVVGGAAGAGAGAKSGDCSSTAPAAAATSFFVFFPLWQIQLMQCTILARGQASMVQYYTTYYANSSSSSSSSNRRHSSCRRRRLEQVQDLLHSPTLMKLVLEANGPKKDNYGSFLKIYHDILNSCSVARNDVETFHTIDDNMTTTRTTNRPNMSTTSSPNIYSRLAIAVALEHACPINIFDTNIPIDPVERYHHYKDAMEMNELDSAFSTFCIWELRMVVSSNASHEELTWFRSMLRNYRPDLVQLQDYTWKYVQIVRSDVVYKCPVWTPGQPKTYRQLLSGGGKCGPRAWMGRMACQAFGIPIWGLRQPGHAAMSHWTPYEDGWTICLGGKNWGKSFWEGRNGLDFQLEAKARKRGAGDGRGDDLCGLLSGYDTVLCLKWLACIQREPVISSQSAAYLQRRLRTRLWWELALLEMLLLVEGGAEDRGRGIVPLLMNSTTTTNHLQFLQKMKLMAKKTRKERFSSSFPTLQSGDFIIAAASCFKGEEEMPGKVMISKSDQERQEGLQLHVKTEGSFKCIIEDLLGDGNDNTKSTIRYTLQALVATVHSNITNTPLRLDIRDDNTNETGKTYMIQIPYTCGDWAWTEPIEVELASKKSINLLTFHRQGSKTPVLQHDHGLTIKKLYFQKCLQR